MESADRSYALLTDGSTVHVRQASGADFDAVLRMHAALSPDSTYLRFFSFSKRAPEQEARRICREPGPDHVALLAWLDDALVGVASYEVTEQPEVAEVAFAVGDEMHGKGVGTLLLEHLISIGTQHGLRAFTAQTLPENWAMLSVFAAAGLPAARHYLDGVVQLTFPLPGGADDQLLDGYLDTVAARQSKADVASLRYLLEPAAVAVIGASSRPGSVGGAILRNVISAGFAGPVYPVHLGGAPAEGLDCLASAAELPDGVDLAVVAVPSAAVPTVAAECGRRGVRSVVVITAGLGDAGPQLLATCRRYGMRLVGPNCLGIAVPGIGLNATFAASHPAAGSAGLVVQSGGIGIALLEHLSRLGIGISSFVAAGDKYDVSSNDMLMWWERDEQTRLAVLYVESFGNPRAFARTARRVGRRFPVLTVIGGRSAAGQRAAASHTAARPTPVATQQALFGQAGIIATTSLGELVEAAALLSAQPLPAGQRIGIVSNAGGAGVLAADACADNGLQVAVLDGAVQRELFELLPADAAVDGPVDTTAAVSPELFARCLRAVAGDDGVDAVLAIAARMAFADFRQAIATADLSKPVAAVLLDQAEAVAMLRPAGGPQQLASAAVPGFAYPEGAARALAHAVRYRRWLDRPAGQLPDLAGIGHQQAHALVEEFLSANPDGGALVTEQVAALLGCYGIALATGQRAEQGSAVQVSIGVAQDPVFGPVIVFEVGGESAEVLGDRAAALVPLTDADAGDLIGSVRSAPLLLGGGGGQDVTALTELILRVSALADDLPELAELELRPVLAGPDGITVTAAQAKLAPATPADPFLRTLR
jgi:acyl-CoA synthetase (NDP forming)/GNAT superfamily N-acetyltransferase